MFVCAPLIAKFVAEGKLTNKGKNLCEPHTQISTFCPLKAEKTGEERKLPPPTLSTHNMCVCMCVAVHTCPAVMNCLE